MFLVFLGAKCMTLRKILSISTISAVLLLGPAFANAQGVADQLTDRLTSGTNLAASGFLIATGSYLIVIYILSKVLKRFV
ncbi:uncharacterized protein METZ01_LOCUS109192 [marine metagenome]|uniref:Uncharacterized protein n=1 Tax=marine metagenome TaxID=408172 RepID=A0A381WVR6_9ZZZZ